MGLAKVLTTFMKTTPVLQVKAAVVQALRDGTLPRSDYDDDRALVARRVQNHTAKAVVAQQRDTATPAGY